MTEKEKNGEVQNQEQQKMLVKHTNMLNVIIAETYLRHNKMDKDEYLKAIGFEGTNKNEEEAVAIATFNILIEWTKTLLECRRRLDMTNEILKEFLTTKKENKFIEKENK